VYFFVFKSTYITIYGHTELMQHQQNDIPYCKENTTLNLL
jgi:hypothetical protein